MCGGVCESGARISVRMYKAYSAMPHTTPLQSTVQWTYSKLGEAVQPFTNAVSARVSGQEASKLAIGELVAAVRVVHELHSQHVQL